MCPGAEGWRSHWKKQIDRIIRNYDFDGIYFDFWYGRMACENVRHGCGGRFRRGTVLGSREMLMYAYNRLKAKNPRAIIKANTNTLATALITSLVDIRLVGEAIDATGMDDASRRWLHCSYRLGETTEFLWDQTRLSATQKASFATLVNFLPQWYERPRFEPRGSFDDFDVFRSHDDGTGDWRLGLSRSEGLQSVTPGVTVNTVESGGTTLATVMNANPADAIAEIPLRDGWLACEPLSGQLHAPARGALRVSLGAGQYRHVLLLQTPRAPHLLYALGARLPAQQSYNPGTRKMQVKIDAAEGSTRPHRSFHSDPGACGNRRPGRANPLLMEAGHVPVDLRVGPCSRRAPRNQLRAVRSEIGARGAGTGNAWIRALIRKIVWVGEQHTAPEVHDDQGTVAWSCSVGSDSRDSSQLRLGGGK